MHFNSTISRIIHLSRARPTQWPEFIIGWMRRGHGVVPCVLPGTKKLLLLPIRHFYESYQYFSESMEGRSELGSFLDRLQPGDIFYDIGGFRGVYTVAAKMRAGDAVAVHVFEPIPRNHEAVARICELNHFTGVKVVPLAVGEGDLIAGLVHNEDGMLRLGDTSARGEVQFKTVSLDQYIADGAPPPSIMKIDVEGYELSVLNGAHHCLKKCRPRLWMEVHPNFLKAQGKTEEDVFELLREFGYTISYFEDHESRWREMGFHVWCV